jgi:NAD(P)H-flavin reductase
MAMLRHRRARRSAVDARLLLSARTLDDVLFRDEVERLGEDGVAGHVTLTRAAPPGWAGWARRIDAEMIAAVGPGPERAPRVFVCGPTPFVEAAAGLLVALGTRRGGSAPSASDRQEAEMDRFTDGNALAGLLEELFVAEVTTAQRTCQSCGEEHAIGEHRLFTAAGYVLRCPRAATWRRRSRSCPTATSSLYTGRGA